VGGFNISRECHDDGAKTGWYNLGLCFESPLGGELAVISRWNYK
jgi:hypothetical protein